MLLSPWLAVAVVVFVIVPLVGVPRTGVTIVNEVHVPVGVYEPPNSNIVSAASRTVFARFVEVRPVKVSSPLCPEIDRLAALPVVFWFSVGKVQFAKFPEVGVPKTGVTKVRLVHVPVGV